MRIKKPLQSQGNQDHLALKSLGSVELEMVWSSPPIIKDRRTNDGHARLTEDLSNLIRKNGTMGFGIKKMITNRTLSRTKGVRPLKVDLHLHTAEDPLDRVRHTARELILRASREGFDVLSITNHHQLTFNQDLFSFARELGILLIPGVEATIQKRHVLLLNPPHGKTVSDFSSLSRIRRPETLIIAPHPYFPGIHSLNGRLLRNLQLFDAIEYCHFYSSRINLFNLKAVEVSQSNGFPLVGNSDAHFLSQLGTTYSLVYAEKNLESIFTAIRKNRVQVITRPLSPFEIGSIVRLYLRMKLRGRRIKARRWPRTRLRDQLVVDPSRP